MHKNDWNWVKVILEHISEKRFSEKLEKRGKLRSISIDRAGNFTWNSNWRSIFSDRSAGFEIFSKKQWISWRFSRVLTNIDIIFCKYLGNVWFLRTKMCKSMKKHIYSPKKKRFFSQFLPNVRRPTLIASCDSQLITISKVSNISFLLWQINWFDLKSSFLRTKLFFSIFTFIVQS